MDRRIMLRVFEDRDVMLLNRWLYHYIAEYDNQPAGFCQYYRYSYSGEAWQGDMKTDGIYNIDYLIGEKEFLGRGLGRQMMEALIDKIRLCEDAERIRV